MIIVADANLVASGRDVRHPHHTDSVRATRVLGTAGHHLCVVPQSLYECWVTLTKPATPPRPGMGLSPADAYKEIVAIKLLFDLLPDSDAIYAGWEHLVVAHAVSGRSAHDTRIVAAMQVHSVTHLLTFNVKHFTRYKNITVIDPVTV